VAISELSSGASVLGRQTLGCWPGFKLYAAYQTRRVYACLQRLGERASLTRQLVRLMRPSRVDSLTLLSFRIDPSPPSRGALHRDWARNARRGKMSAECYDTGSVGLEKILADATVIRVLTRI
jgi:hypothetical protein